MPSDTLSEYEQFLAKHFGSALQDASDVLLLLRGQIPKQEFAQLAGPLFAALATFADETKRLQFQQRERFWTSEGMRYDPGFHAAPPTPADFQKEAERNKRAFGLTLAGLQEELEIAAGLFEANPCPAVVPQ